MGRPVPMSERSEGSDQQADDSRLDQVENDIADARSQAEDAGILEDPDEPKFHESGDINPELDDQQIAPPG